LRDPFSDRRSRLFQRRGRIGSPVHGPLLYEGFDFQRYSQDPRSVPLPRECIIIPYVFLRVGRFFSVFRFSTSQLPLDGRAPPQSLPQVESLSLLSIARYDESPPLLSPAPQHVTLRSAPARCHPSPDFVRDTSPFSRFFLFLFLALGSFRPKSFWVSIPS